jgi:hypothetical protein
MDEEPRKEYKLPSMLEMFDKVQSQINPPSSVSRELDNISKIVENLDFTTQWPHYAATQDLIAQFSSVFSQNNLILDNDTTKKMRELVDSSSYNAVALETLKLNLPFQSLLEKALLDFKPPTQSISPEGILPQSQFGDLNSIISAAANAFKQYNQFDELESFKAISRLKNFPRDSVWQQDYSEGHEITESSIVEAKKIDAEISDEIISVNDFNDLSEETQNSLKQVFSEYYEYFIIKIIASLCLLQENLNEDLDLSNKSFIFVNSLEGSIFFIGNYWNQNKAAIINGLITTSIYNAFIWLFFMK